jgi:hypothetical protein
VSGRVGSGFLDRPVRLVVDDVPDRERAALGVLDLHGRQRGGLRARVALERRQRGEQEGGEKDGDPRRPHAAQGTTRAMCGGT